MATKNMQHNIEAYTITSADGSSHMTFLPERGGVASSLIMPTKHGPKELLFQHDFFWQDHWHDLPGGWPFLFPVCARLERNSQSGRYLYDGKQYALKIHGFSWFMPWYVIAESHDSITLRLTANEATQRDYPFNFEVILHYHITRDTLSCQQTYINHDHHPMPYYAGFHPYLKTPPLHEGKEQVMLEYHPIKRFEYNNTFTDVIGEQALIDLPTAITHPQVNEQLTLLGDDKEVRLHYPDHSTLHITAEGLEDPDLFPYLQLYTIKEKDFFCIEHWMSFPNALNTVAGVRWLQPGTQEIGVLKLWLTE